MGLVVIIIALVFFGVGFDQTLLRVDCALGVRSACDEIVEIRSPKEM